MPMLSFAAIGVIFGLLAGVIAFVITYEEYQHHGLGRRRTFKESLGTGAAAFAFFFLAALVIGLFLPPAR
ncbi:MAG TPA: hypothetical protein VN806_04405 [Caulobacteraceae bacterium]|nr:hypothetical protein [Caulobacteraceae bacterium]